MRKSSLLLILYLFSACYCRSQDILDSRHTLKFANYLYDQQDYESAINEYYRACFFSECSILNQTRLFQSCLYSGKFPEGINIFEAKHPSFTANNDTLDLLYGKLLLSGDRFSEVYSLVGHSKSLTEEHRIFLTLCADLKSGKWNDPTEIKSMVLSCSNMNPLEPVVMSIESAKYKKPGLSLALSAIVPGSGKAYSGYWKDGITSFLISALTTWQAYRGFHIYGTSRPYPWIYATLSLSFYAANLYGSYKSANKRNYDTREGILKQFDNVFSKMYRF